MSSILLSYPIEEILLILIVACGALFGVYKAYCYVKNQVDEYVVQKHDEMELPNRVTALEKSNEDQQNMIELLIESERNNIKGYILNVWKESSREGYIEEKEWDVLHQKFNIYKRMGGNSWVEGVIKDIDSLEIR